MAPPKTLDGLTVLNFRLSREWTQAKAAAWWGCTERAWRHYEKGSRTPPRPLMKRILANRVRTTAASPEQEERTND